MKGLCGTCFRSQFFPQTGQTISNRFLEVWQSNHSFADSLFINGLPLSDSHQEQSLTDGKIYRTQWFERARYEEHPENQPPYDVQLSPLGAIVAVGRADAPFLKIADPHHPTAHFVPETGHTVGASSVGGRAIYTFWETRGGLAQFGYPLSQPFQEVTRSTDPKVAGKSFLVQYFERQRFEYHPENKGTQFEILLGRLGAERQQVPVIEPTIPGRPGPELTVIQGTPGPEPTVIR
jgi:polysaccharide biosynthesis protein PslG